MVDASAIPPPRQAPSPCRQVLEAGIIARADDRGDSVLQIAPPLISDRRVLDDIVDALGQVLAAAGEHMGISSATHVG